MPHQPSLRNGHACPGVAALVPLSRGSIEQFLRQREAWKFRREGRRSISYAVA
ncbi:hypothetical protein PC116_g9505 [Phytophthora cactorum]|uniref:Uncharacterized protein n=1 Tax=Phytophthora cactorum TaxID=29920 RepID=A0A8T1DT53_9STRA|nr:hypothetical protein PC114_g9812 [Phytophthora cactorum]KAG2942969.1 hypothetical protein PC117_g9578 [Phytophthora cactorum]KAG3014430.1 hypothetical protein PC120_g12689 [Phytophthora cactorum]KAG3173437.1 hypothetical protein PC128_g18276 [Phytophthora cactorum]KAG4056730.1 hypothetical protein PC123_g8232 [Phytophthora cactorum]